MNFKYQFIKFCFPKKPTKRVLAPEIAALQEDLFSFLSAFPAHLQFLHLLVWYWSCNVSVVEVVLWLRVRLHLTHRCPVQHLFFPAAKSNTKKNVFNNTWGTAASTSYSADADDCPCLQAQAKSSCWNSSCIRTYACITLTTMLYFTGNTIFRGDQKIAPHLSGINSLRRHILPDKDKLQKSFS